MQLIKIMLLGALLAGASAPAFSEDGYDRSLKMNEQFRADQKRLWGDKNDTEKQKTERSCLVKRTARSTNPDRLHSSWRHPLLGMGLQRQGAFLLTTGP